jgi:hypothetical protein
VGCEAVLVAAYVIHPGIEEAGKGSCRRRDKSIEHGGLARASDSNESASLFSLGLRRLAFRQKGANHSRREQEPQSTKDERADKVTGLVWYFLIPWHRRPTVHARGRFGEGSFPARLARYECHVAASSD